MKKALMALIVTMFALSLVACGPSLGESFDDVEESAPALCKDFCEEVNDCEFDDNRLDADQTDVDRIEADSVKGCITDCAYPISEGTFIYEWNDDGEIKVERWVSGGEYKDFAQCFYDIWLDFEDDFLRCNDDDDFTLRTDDEEVCDAMEECYSSLDDLDVSCEWDNALGYCDCEDDNYLWNNPLGSFVSEQNF